MSDINTVKAQIQSLIDLANTTTGNQDTNLTDGVNALVQRYRPEGSLEGLTNGYDVMFYDENNEGLAFYSIKEGHIINPPVYNCTEWQTADGVVATFPYTPTGDIIFYALISTYVDQLYEHFEIDKGVYPYVFLAAYNYGSSKCTCIISFGTELKSGGIGVGGSVKSRTDLFNHFAFGDVTSLDYLVNVARTQWKPSHLTDKSSSTIEMNTKYIYATNYEISETNISKLKAYYNLNQ